MAKLDPAARTGKRHHTVPKCVMDRFADTNERVWRRDPMRHRDPGSGVAVRTRDLGIRDFYTAPSRGGGFDARLEDVFGVVEDATAVAVRRLLDPFRPVTPADLAVAAPALTQMMAFQIVRGPRRRREIELTAEWHVKVMGEGRIPSSELAALSVDVPPTEHLALLTVAEQLHPYLARRPMALVHLDQPLLFLSDEPVFTDLDAPVEHTADCSRPDTPDPVRRPRRRSRGRDRRVIHLYPSRRLSLGEVPQVGIPLSPRTVLLLGPIGHRSARPVYRLSGEEASAYAEHVNQRMVDGADEWLIAHPDNQMFRDRALPEPAPLIHICDGHSPSSAHTRSAPSAGRRYQRIATWLRPGQEGAPS